MHVAWDTETEWLAQGSIAPPMICMTLSTDGVEGSIYKPDDAEELIAEFLDHKEIHNICHNAHFDLAVVCEQYPGAISLVWKALMERRVSCTLIREKLLNLATYGKLRSVELPYDTRRLEYSLAALARDRCDLAMSEDKHGEDVWRRNYVMLKDLKIEQWPDEAIDYAITDAVVTHQVWQSQEEARQHMIESEGIDPFEVEAFRVAADFALFLQTCHGWRIDEDLRDTIAADLEEKCSSEAIAPLVSAGILRAPQKPRPYGNQLKRVTELLGGPRDSYSPEERTFLEENGVKFTQEVKASKDMSVLRKIIVMASQRAGIPAKTTATGDISTAEEVVKDLMSQEPVLEEYHAWQKLQKLVTTELPRIAACQVHPNYDVLVETGRTSSFASKEWPSCNIQNVDPRVRPCYIPRDGQILLSTDYSGLELATLAQKCYSLFGESVLRDKINQGIDAHAYLGAQLAYYLDPKFQAACEKNGITDPDSIYKVFSAFKSAGESEQKWYSNYRTFAKPTGLGYPGGLGPDTFISFAKATYGVVVESAEQARQLKQIWLDTYPEMNLYFAWITNNCEVGDSLYAYSTPLGMWRTGATYCSACNGAAMQGPAAEGALLAVIEIQRACYDPLAESILFGCRSLAFIHDEVILEIPDDDLASDRADEVERLMVENMQKVLPDMKMRAESVLMRRWDKYAEPVYSKEGRLVCP